MPKRVIVSNEGRVTRSRLNKEEAPILNYCSSVLNLRVVEGKVSIQFPGALQRDIRNINFVDGPSLITIGCNEFSLQSEYLRHEKCFSSWDFLLTINRLTRPLTANDVKYILHAVHVLVLGYVGNPTSFYTCVDSLLKRKRKQSNTKLLNNLQNAIVLAINEIEESGNCHAKMFQEELKVLGDKVNQDNCIEILHNFTLIQTRYKSSLYLADTLVNSFVSALTLGGAGKTLEQLSKEFMSWHSTNCFKVGVAKVYKIIFDWKHSPDRICDSNGEALWDAFTTRELS